MEAAHTARQRLRGATWFFIRMCLVLGAAAGLLVPPAPASLASSGFDGLLDLWVDGKGYSQVSSTKEWNEKRLAIQEVLFDFLKPRPDELQPLDVKILSEEDAGGYVRRKIEYSTLPGERVRAYLLIPHRQAEFPGPAILALHQTTSCGKDEVVGLCGSSSMAYGLDLVRKGYVVLAPDGITMGERADGPVGGETSEVYKRHPQWSALGIMTWEAIQAVNVLVSLPEVDPERIGCVGHSHGGYGALLLAAFDSRLKATVSSCGFVGLSHDSNPMRWAKTFEFVALPELRPYIKKRTFPFDFHELLALIAPRPFMNICSTNDPVFPGSAESARLADSAVAEVYERVYGSRSLLETVTHSSGHSFPPSVKQEAYRWLNKWLQDKDPGYVTEPVSPAGLEPLSAVGAVREEGYASSARNAGGPDVLVGSLAQGMSVFRFRLGGNSRVRLSIYDVTGRRLKALIDGSLPAGLHEVVWDGSREDGRPAPPGIHFYKLETDGEVRTGKVFVLR